MKEANDSVSIDEEKEEPPLKKSRTFPVPAAYEGVPHVPAFGDSEPPAGEARRIDGKRIAQVILDDVRTSVKARIDAGARAPGLAVILVGDDPASRIYVRTKERQCRQCGILSFTHTLPEAATQSELLALIRRLNADDTVDGILVQQPLPAALDAAALVEAVDPAKDVDGFHPYSIGRLCQRNPLFRPCTPLGVLALLRHTGVTPFGLDTVVIGASNIVGRPMGLELLLAGCSVTIVHRWTPDLEAHVRRADVVVAAAGKPGLVRGEWVKPGAVVIDVGINRMEDGKIVGDVDFDVAKRRAAWITPVPGGVGPMTVAMLLHNTLGSAARRAPAAAGTESAAEAQSAAV
eukprot:TRINITY_DN7293_c1_g1_i1.p1 TRINITY_DN7293_c1_g1~~TRINITY_DN7293_c1_g1_i1.p1  ORF type:complete len:357 (-),score=96.21 TRINITY_DN7293_c1_g1_i1:47-1090(-)